LPHHASPTISCYPAFPSIIPCMSPTSTSSIYSSSLYYSLPISFLHFPSFPTRRSSDLKSLKKSMQPSLMLSLRFIMKWIVQKRRSEEHTSELQSRIDLVCRLLLE